MELRSDTRLVMFRSCDLCPRQNMCKVTFFLMKRPHENVSYILIYVERLTPFSLIQAILEEQVGLQLMLPLFLFGLWHALAMSTYASFTLRNLLWCPRGKESFVAIADLEGWGYKNSDIQGYLAAQLILQVQSFNEKTSCACSLLNHHQL